MFGRKPKRERMTNRVIHTSEKRLEPITVKVVDPSYIIQCHFRFELTAFCLNWQ